MLRKRLGQVLQERHLLSPLELDEAVREQQGKALRLGEVLLQRGSVRRQDLAAAIEDITGVPYIDAEQATASPDVLAIIPEALVRRYCALPLAREGRKLAVLMAEPQDLKALQELQFAAGMQITPRFGFRSEVEAAIDRHYAAQSAAEKSLLVQRGDATDVEYFIAGSATAGSAGLKEFQAELVGERTPAVRLVSGILATAAERGASDIHIEQAAGDTAVRIRVDGILRELTRLPAELRSSVISRVKILADMDIAERRMPQDGRCLARVGNRQFDLRISTLPTQYGEKMVIRLLDPRASAVTFAALGFSEAHERTLRKALAQPQGMILVTGPTGSGKSTTLYAALNVLRSERVNISTIEDPIEYVLDGINQVQVNPKAGRTFAGCLRSLLRQDPNIIMVGEIRDGETAEIALQAAQTGHLVLSTLHTNDSASAITRLIDLGVPPFLIAASVSAVLAQRLVRRLCTCREPAEPTPEDAARLLEAGVWDLEPHLFAPRGCEACDQTGYKGRVGIFELLAIDEQLRVHVREGARLQDLRNAARGHGMRLMQEDALDKMRAGITSLEEVLRVVPFEQHAGARACRKCQKLLSVNFLFCPFCGTVAAETAGGLQLMAQAGGTA